MTMTTATDQAFEEFLDAHADERLESYKELVRIPSISALPEHVPDCRRAAEWIAADLERIGVEHVEVAETGGHPVVYGDWLHADGAGVDPCPAPWPELEPGRPPPTGSIPRQPIPSGP